MQGTEVRIESRCACSAPERVVTIRVITLPSVPDSRSHRRGIPNRVSDPEEIRLHPSRKSISRREWISSAERARCELMRNARAIRVVRAAYPNAPTEKRKMLTTISSIVKPLRGRVRMTDDCQAQGRLRHRAGIRGIKKRRPYCAAVSPFQACVSSP